MDRGSSTLITPWQKYKDQTSPRLVRIYPSDVEWSGGFWENFADKWISLLEITGQCQPMGSAPILKEDDKKYEEDYLTYENEDIKMKKDDLGCSPPYTNDRRCPPRSLMSPDGRTHRDNPIPDQVVRLVGG